MEKCYVKCKLCLQEAVQEIAKEEGWKTYKMAAFTVAAKEGLFSVAIEIGENGIEINQIDLSESHVVVQNIVHFENGPDVSYPDCVSRDVFESGVLNNNENFKIRLLLDYKIITNKNKTFTLGGEKIIKMFIDGDNRLNIFTKNPIKEVKRDKIGDLPKETIYFGERDGFCSCERRAKDINAEPERLTEEFFNEILYTMDHIILVNVNNKLKPIKVSKAFELLPDGWYIDIYNDNNKKSMRRLRKYCIFK